MGDVADRPFVLTSSVKKLILVTTLFGYAALIFYLLYVVGIAQLVGVIAKASLGLYALAILSLVASIFFNTIVWRQLLSSLQINITMRRAFTLYWVGLFVDNLIPGGWSGDLFKAYLLNKDPNIQSGKAVASVVAKNMYEAIFNLGGMIFALALLLLNYRLETSLLIGLGGIMLLLTLPLVVLLLASFHPVAAKKIVANIIEGISHIYKNRKALTSLEGKIDKALGDYHEGMEILLKNPRMLTKPIIFSFLGWIFEIITLLLVFASLAQLIAVDKVVIVHSIAGNVESQGYAFVGYAQIITSEIYRALGVSFAIGASVALLGGVVFFLFKTVISYTAFHFTVISPRKSNRQNSGSTDSDRESGLEGIMPLLPEKAVTLDDSCVSKTATV
ncbi:MAG: flippase-like domain-containing protein [Candidatus Bathyarchaeota archaeon]|nr:flippase-like domain-containing protein [Candidatus Bathyarchaeota archaeon]